MAKKVTVLRDELNIKGGGIYCFLPFENLDKHKKAVFKIGLAIDFNHRTETYHTYFPLGVYMVAFLKNPSIPMRLRGHTKADTVKEYYLKIERYIFHYVISKGGQRIHSTTHSNRGGETEWFYTDEHVIHEAFTEASKMFGGEPDLFYLEGKDPNTHKFFSINQIARANDQKKPNYVGKIIYFV